MNDKMNLTAGEYTILTVISHAYFMLLSSFKVGVVGYYVFWVPNGKE